MERNVPPEDLPDPLEAEEDYFYSGRELFI
jgi:hypothetical protein